MQWFPWKKTFTDTSNSTSNPLSTILWAKRTYFSFQVETTFWFDTFTLLWVADISFVFGHSEGSYFFYKFQNWLLSLFFLEGRTRGEKKIESRSYGNKAGLQCWTMNAIHPFFIFGKCWKNIFKWDKFHAFSTVILNGFSSIPCLPLGRLFSFCNLNWWLQNLRFFILHHFCWVKWNYFFWLVFFVWSWKPHDWTGTKVRPCWVLKK